MVDLVVNYIELAHIRPLNMVFILMRVLKWLLPAGYFFNRGQNHLIRKIMVDLVVHHIEFAHIQQLNMVLMLMRVFIVGLPAGYFFNQAVRTIWLERPWSIKLSTISTLSIFDH